MALRHSVIGVMAISLIGQAVFSAGIIESDRGAHGGNLSPAHPLVNSHVNSQIQNMFVDGIYKVTSDLSLFATRILGVEDIEPEDLEGVTFDYPAGEKIHLEQVFDPQMGVLYKLTAVVNPDEDQFPTQILLTPEQLKDAKIEFIRDGSVATLEQEYSPYEETEVAAAGGGQARRRTGKKIGSCYKMVKQYLLRKGMVRTYLPGGSAYMAAGILPRHGFSKTGSGPGGAKINDVCVYRGGWHGHGHIEVRVAGGWYYGPTSRNAIRGRTFIGCFRKN